MFGSKRFDRLRELFAKRFEPDGDGFVYRSSATAAPVSVSPAERDEFVALFNRRLTWLNWGMVALMTAGIGVYAWAAISFDLPVSSVPLYLGTGVIFAAYLLAGAWCGPRRSARWRDATLREPLGRARR